MAEIDDYLGNLYTATGDFGQAALHLRQSLAFYEQENLDYVAVARVCASTARMHEARGDMRQAEFFFSRAVAIERKQVPAGQKVTAAHIHLLSELTELGIFYVRRGDYARADQLLGEVRAIGELAKAENYHIGGNVNLFAASYALRGQYDRALELAREALASLNPREIERFLVLLQLGTIHTSKAEYAQAEHFLK